MHFYAFIVFPYFPIADALTVVTTQGQGVPGNKINEPPISKALLSDVVYRQNQKLKRENKHRHEKVDIDIFSTQLIYENLTEIIKCYKCYVSLSRKFMDGSKNITHYFLERVCMVFERAL